MRRALATVPPAAGATQSGTSRRVEVLEIPDLPVPPEQAEILPRLRFAAGSLADTPLVECMALLLSPFAPPARGGALSIVAPDDDEAAHPGRHKGVCAVPRH